MGRTSDARQRLLDAALALIWERSYSGTSVDAICERAGVKKGSFYHFFSSKADLAAAAIEASHERRRAFMDDCFSPSVPPLERLRRYLGAAYEEQARLCRETGRVLGCPLFTLGAEICHEDERLRQVINGILDQHLAYFENAVRDAAAAGIVEAADPAARARGLFSMLEGALTQARIRNDPAFLKHLPDEALAYLGADVAAAEG